MGATASGAAAPAPVGAVTASASVARVAAPPSAPSPGIPVAATDMSKPLSSIVHLRQLADAATLPEAMPDEIADCLERMVRVAKRADATVTADEGREVLEMLEAAAARAAKRGSASRWPVSALCAVSEMAEMLGVALTDIVPASSTAAAGQPGPGPGVRDAVPPASKHAGVGTGHGTSTREETDDGDTRDIVGGAGGSSRAPMLSSKLPTAVLEPALSGAAGVVREVEYLHTVRALYGERVMPVEADILSMPPPVDETASSSTTWTCSHCTFVNAHTSSASCAVCALPAGDSADTAPGEADAGRIRLAFTGGDAFGGAKLGFLVSCRRVSAYPEGWSVSASMDAATTALELGVSSWLGGRKPVRGSRLLAVVRRLCEDFGKMLAPWPDVAVLDGGAVGDDVRPAPPPRLPLVEMRREVSAATTASSYYEYSDSDGGSGDEDALVAASAAIGAEANSSGALVVRLGEGGEGPGALADDAGASWGGAKGGAGGAVVDTGALSGKGARSVVVPVNADVPPSQSDVLNAWFLPPADEVAATRILTPKQARAMKHVVTKAGKESEAAMAALIKAAAKVGSFSRADVMRTLKYIRDEAPIIVHIHLDRLIDKLVADTHLRNQFETGTSCGSLNSQMRVDWENRLFGGVYGSVDDTKGFERVKYGVLNVVNDPKGISCARQYGSSYLVLRGVRLRCSFADRDSSCVTTKLACCESYAHVLSSFSPAELKATLEVGTRRKDWHDSSVISIYKELQIHGEVTWAEHVTALRVNPAHRDNEALMAKIRRFCEHNDIELLWAE
uniref:Uncharacterized protein n=1 Tax=Bicosoecida sp. CB-2014 TaxID=1486930 RepID=A0A7S1G8D8_9STRA|eukprot:CAMPEP_0203823802 /NCGR_PEP_ID=MMETSP0115-20131106/50124_1 /ASSEMBLY_ACC=CAM_ASM_000227 /TAXON_ID=33651 /ORGANISM="Bicosoecid sp, Strain ms1" /LENGTH=791 /DNA_ID=CAMNT_0050732835 /DNA_START=77 /DNA_END=2452 /DNA_ORIENTATION=-